MLSFRRLAYCNIFDITSPENDVLVNLLSRRRRPVCGAIFGTKGPHLGVRKKQYVLSSAKCIQPSGSAGPELSKHGASGPCPGCHPQASTAFHVSEITPHTPLRFSKDNTNETPVDKAPKSSRSQRQQGTRPRPGTLIQLYLLRCEHRRQAARDRPSLLTSDVAD